MRRLGERLGLGGGLLPVAGLCSLMTSERGHVPVFPPPPFPSHEGTTETVRVTGVWMAHCKGGCNVFASCTQASCNVTLSPPSMRRSLFSHPLNQD